MKPINRPVGASLNSACVLLKTLNLAVFLTVLWLLWTGTGGNHTVAHLANQQAQQMRAHATLNDRLASAEDRLDEQRSNELIQLAAAVPAKQPEVDSEVTNQLRLEIDGYRQQLSAVEKTAELKQALNTVIGAEFLKTTNSTQAAEQLLSVKEVIWRKSTEEAAVEQSLQSLMAPIDILAGEWQQGFTDNSVSTIYRVLGDSITILERPGGSR